MGDEEVINSYSEDEEDIDKKKCCCKCCCKSCSEDIMFGFTFPGRLIMTLYSFQALFFLYNFIINFIFLLPGMLYFTENGFVIFLVIIIYVFFASLCSNLLIIPTYELLLFSFIRYKNIFAHLMSIKSVMNIIHGSNEEEIIIYEKSNIISDILFLIIEFFYFIGFILGFFSQTMIFKDIIREIIFIIIYFYYLVIFFAYIFVAFDLKIQIIIKIIKKCRCLIFWSSMDEYIKEIF